MKNIGYFVAVCALVTSSVFAGCGCARKAPVKKVLPTQEGFSVVEAGCTGCQNKNRQAPVQAKKPLKARTNAVQA